MSPRAFLTPFVFFVAFSVLAQQAIEKPDLAQLYPTLEAKENALRNARIIKYKMLGTGITNPLKLTMRDGNTEFYAVFKDVNVRKPGLTKLSDSTEVDFKDSWQFDVAAYELDKLLGLNMVPVTVERTYKGNKGMVQWWIENAMTEGDRKEKGLSPPDQKAWNQWLCKVRLFDKLVYNIDRNLGNLLITPDWKVWMIDHSRCFKNLENVKAKENLSRFSISFMDRLRKLNETQVRERCGKYLSVYEIRAMMKRREEMLQLYEKARLEQSAFVLDP